MKVFRSVEAYARIMRGSWALDADVRAEVAVMRSPEVVERLERAKILLVEGDDASRERTAALLSEHFDVTSAPDGESAIGLLARQRYDVLCAADDAHGIRGRELLGRAAALPDAPRGILLIGQPDGPLGFEGLPGFQLVFKPFEPQQLVDTVHREYALVRMRRLLPAAR
ncbi:MAG: hypothetical protein NVSMB23_23100 [Myxococcales bacterium]